MRTIPYRAQQVLVRHGARAREHIQTRPFTAGSLLEFSILHIATTIESGVYQSATMYDENPGIVPLLGVMRRRYLRVFRAELQTSLERESRAPRPAQRVSALFFHPQRRGFDRDIEAQRDGALIVFPEAQSYERSFFGLPGCTVSFLEAHVELLG